MAVELTEIKHVLDEMKTAMHFLQEDKLVIREKLAKKEEKDVITEAEIRKLHMTIDEFEAEFKRLNEERAADKIKLENLEAQAKAIPTKGAKTNDTFDIRYAIKGLAFNDWTDAKGNDRQVERKQLHKVLSDNKVSKKALIDETGSSGGAYLIPDEFSSQIIDLLRNKNIFANLPVSRVNTNAETFKMPKLTGGATAYMVGSGAQITVSSETIGQATMTQKKVGIFVPVAGELIRQSNPAVMSIVKGDMTKVGALKAENQFLMGAGGAGNMTGVYNTSNINSVSMGTDGAKFSSSTNIDKLMQTVREVEMDNGTMEAWVMNARTKWDLREVKDAQGNYILTLQNNAGDPPMLLGYPYYVTNEIPSTYTQGQNSDCTFILAGQWSDILIAEWLGVQIEASNVATYVDGEGTTHSCFQEDEVAIRLIASYDILVRHPAAFCKLIGIRSNYA